MPTVHAWAVAQSMMDEGLVLRWLTLEAVTKDWTEDSL